MPEVEEPGKECRVMSWTSLRTPPPSRCQAGGGRDGQEALLHSLLLLHPAVLEPGLHLGLLELQGRSNLHPVGAGQVLVEVKLFSSSVSCLVVKLVRTALAWPA